MICVIYVIIFPKLYYKNNKDNITLFKTTKGHSRLHIPCILQMLEKETGIYLLINLKSNVDNQLKRFNGPASFYQF